MGILLDAGGLPGPVAAPKTRTFERFVRLPALEILPVHATATRFTLPILALRGPPSGMVSGTSGPDLREQRARARVLQNAPPTKDVPPESRLRGRLEIEDAIFHGAAHATGEAGAALLDWCVSLGSAGLAITAGT
jgi:hypothetical protein